MTTVERRCAAPRPVRRVARPAIAAGAAAVLVTASCTTDRASAPTTQSFESAQEDVTVEVDLSEHLDLSGHEDTTLYLLAGPDIVSYDVYRHRAPDGTEQLTHSEPRLGVSAVAASPAELVLADASTGRDEIVRHTDDGQVPLGGEPRGSRAFAPDLGPDGALVYTRFTDDAGGSADATFQVVTRPAFDGPPEVVLERPTRLAAQWGPDGTIVVLAYPPRSDPEAPSELLLVDPTNGSVESLDTPLERANLVVGHPDRPETVVDETGASLDDGSPTGGPTQTGEAGLLHVRTGEWTPLPSGWVGWCFDPTGEHLLVAHDDRIALAPTHAPDRIRDVGTVTNGIAGPCAWVAAR